MRYQYKAKKLTGEVIEGVLEADNQKLVINKLQKMQVFPISVRQLGAGRGMNADVSFHALRRISGRDVTTFSREISDLLKAGLPLVRCLDVIAQQTPNPRFIQVIKSVNSDVSGGTALADALAKHPKIFNPLYSSMVRAGELGGMLDSVMDRLAAFMEAEQETRSKIIAALTYPAFMVVVCIGVITVLFTVVVPNFMVMFEESDIDLPVSTQMLLNVSTFFSSYWWVFFLVAGMVIFLFRKYLKTDAGRLQFDRFKLNLPLLGDMIRKREIAKFARTLGTLLANGVTILKALAITEQVITNKILKNEIDKFADNIKEGEKLSTRMEESDIFPPVAVNMVAVGEETGNLETTLQRVADTFESETDRLIKTLTSIIEPVMIVVMAVVVGFIVFAMIMPIFTISQSM
ncbi:MAG: type II secretion system inner membrane protein GspF [Candidatus Omnitrophota bacterium]